MIWTDVVQSLIMFAGVLVTLSYTWIATGQSPLDWWAIAGEVQRQHTSPPWFDLDLTRRVTILTAALNLFFWITCTHCSDQMVVQRYFTTPSLKAALRSFLIGAVAELTVTALLVMSGLALLAFYTKHPTFLSREIAGSGSADKWFPYFIAHQLPVGLGGLILSALFAAGMSSISSGINSVSAVLVTDIAPSGRANNNLTRARWLSLAIGVLVTALAAGLASLAEVHNITELMQKGFNIFLGPLAALFFIGMFLPRSTSRSAIPAVLFGLAVSIAWSYWRELRLPEMLADVLPDYALFQTLGIDKLVGAKASVPTFTLAIALPWATTVLTAFLLSLVVERPGKHRGRDWTWYAVMRRRT